MFGMMEGIFSFIRRQVGLRTDGADAAGSLHAKVTDIKNRIPSSIVKSVQRGVHSGSENDITIAINTVNPAKCLFFVTPKLNGTASASLFQPYLKSLTATKITTAPSYYSVSGNREPMTFSWQLIEFY